VQAANRNRAGGARSGPSSTDMIGRDRTADFEALLWSDRLFGQADRKVVLDSTLQGRAIPARIYGDNSGAA